MTVIDGTTDEQVAVITEPSATDAVGVPTSAELSPGGQWLAYVADLGLSGMTEVRVTRIGDALDPADGEAITPIESDVEVGSSFAVGRSVAGSPFVDRMSWSPDGHWLAVTIADPDTLEVDSDVWIFDVTDGSSHRLTDAGNAFAGSFVPATDDDADGVARLWVSLAGEAPQSHLVELTDDAEIATDRPGGRRRSPTRRRLPAARQPERRVRRSRGPAGWPSSGEHWVAVRGRAADPGRARPRRRARRSRRTRAAVRRPRHRSRRIHLGVGRLEPRRRRVRHLERRMDRRVPGDAGPVPGHGAACTSGTPPTRAA